MPKAYSQHYLDGIKEGREWVNQYGADLFIEHLAATKATIKSFAADSPVGQMLRGERDFLINYGKKNGLLT